MLFLNKWKYQIKTKELLYEAFFFEKVYSAFSCVIIFEMVEDTDIILCALESSISELHDAQRIIFIFPVFFIVEAVESFLKEASVFPWILVFYGKKNQNIKVCYFFKSLMLEKRKNLVFLTKKRQKTVYF